MTDAERQLCQQAIQRCEIQARDAQRTIEVLANLLNHCCFLVDWQTESYIRYILGTIPYLERVPMDYEQRDNPRAAHRYVMMSYPNLPDTSQIGPSYFRFHDKLLELVHLISGVPPSTEEEKAEALKKAMGRR